MLASGVISTPFRARIDMISGFPVFANQPFLKELKEFILTDLGSHTLDTARRCPPPRYSWADPAYDVVHSSIVPA